MLDCAMRHHMLEFSMSCSESFSTELSLGLERDTAPEPLPTMRFMSVCMPVPTSFVICALSAAALHRASPVEGRSPQWAKTLTQGHVARAKLHGQAPSSHSDGGSLRKTGRTESLRTKQ